MIVYLKNCTSNLKRKAIESKLPKGFTLVDDENVAGIDYILEDNYVLDFKNTTDQPNWKVSNEDFNNEEVITEGLDGYSSLGGSGTHNKRKADLVCHLKVMSNKGETVYNKYSAPIEVILMDSPFSDDVDLDSVLYYKEMNRCFALMNVEEYAIWQPVVKLISLLEG